MLPRGTTPLRLGHGGNDYHRGHYYQHDLRGYVVIPAPVGAVAPSLPEGDRTIVIDGIAYHEYGGVYYRGGPAGYTVVPIAQTPQDPGATEAMAGHIAPTPAQHTTVINVLNKNGSYTPVTLQLASSGMYIGPQGEVYPNLPAAQQLQAMYGK